MLCIFHVALVLLVHQLGILGCEFAYLGLQLLLVGEPIVDATLDSGDALSNVADIIVHLRIEVWLRL